MRLRVIDLETTGFEATDCVVEIAAWDVLGNCPDELPFFIGQTLVKPPVSIPATASAVHHIVDADVQDAPAWSDAYPAFIDDDVDAYAAHNSRFEEKWLGPIIGKPLIDTYRASLRLWPDAPAHSNQALRYWLKPEHLDRRIAGGSHRALEDSYVTAHLLKLILQQPKVTLDGLILCSQRPALLPTVQFGKHYSKKWCDVERGYLEWVCKQTDMDEDVKFTAQHWLNRVPA